MRLRGVVAIVALFPFCGLAQPGGDDIFLAYADDGVPVFSTQPHAAGHTLFLRASRVPVALATPGGGRGAAVTALVDEAARKHGVDAALLAALIDVESGFDTKAVSPKGARGAMQLMPATAVAYGVADPFDLRQNIDGGARHLKDLIVAHDGNLALALAAYNAGRGRVAKSRQRIPPIRETMIYVPRVLAKMAAYRRMQQESPQ